MRRTIVVIDGRTPRQTATIREVVAKKMRKIYSEDITIAVKEFFDKVLSKATTRFTVTFKKFGQFVIHTTEPIKKNIFEQLENLMRSLFHSQVNVHYRQLPA